MHSVAWTAFVLWGFVALMVVLTVRLLRSRRQALWVVVAGGVGAAIGSYVIGLVLLVVVSMTMFSGGFVAFF